MCSSFFARKDGPYKWALSLGQVMETFTLTNVKDWADWFISKSTPKVRSAVY